MKKILFSLIVFSFAVAVSAQEASNVKAPALALRVSTFDFTTSRAIRVNSIGSVLNNRSWEKLGNMTPSIGLQYFKGLTNKVDFMANLDFASLRYPFEPTASVHAPADKKLYAGIDANLNFKMLSDDYKVVPYLTVGLGVATSAATYYTAYAPAGLGIQIKANHGSFININSTYRLKMSQLTQSHFNHGISYSLPLKLKVKKAIVIPPPPPPADTDNDGVNDEQDKCPSVFSKVNNGCPEIKKEIIERVNKAAKSIYFETGKSVLKPVSYKDLDALVTILNSDATLRVDIGGHTDNAGSEEINVKLSHDRAKAVNDYLISKGIAHERLTYQGYGSSKPVNKNETAAEKAQNRRTELNLRNY
mgnify:CR=1 FL=1